MEIYSFSQPSSIEKVEFTQDGRKIWLARIFPRAGTDASALSELTTTLNQKQDGIIAVPQSEKNVHTLFASGFEAPHVLLRQLTQLGYAKGAPKVEKLSQEAESYSNKIRDASLRIAGISYMVSDLALIGAGFTKKPRSLNLSIAGALYLAAGALMSFFGRKDAHTHLKDLSLKMGDFFTQQGIELPKDGPIAGANRERHSRIVEGMGQFVYNYPSQIFNAVVALCGTQIIRSGLKKIPRRENKIGRSPDEIAAGALVLAGALAGLLIPEKSGKAQMPRPGEEAKKDEKKGIMARTWEWARERPLRVSGILWFANNIVIGWGALKDRKNDPGSHSYKFKFGYMAAALLANALMFISSKQADKRFDIDSDSTQALLSVAAGVVARQPKAVQNRIIEQVSGFMASQPGMHHSASEIAGCIRAQVDGLHTNPFIDHVDSPSTPPEKAVSRHMPNWQRNVDASRSEANCGILRS